ncbi:MAG: NAD(P)-binding protein [Sphingomonas sp.]
MKIGIVGAGMAGLACADALKHQDHDVTLFDKGRGPGGRISTRRVETPLGEASFDHGAQYFTARDPAFRRLVADWADRGLAARWQPAGAEAWVGVPGMNAIVKTMADGHRAHGSSLVQGLARLDHGWQLLGDGLSTDAFDAIIVAVPAEQAATLLGSHDLGLARHALMARSQPCWTAMFVLDAPLDTQRLVLRDQGVIGWAARNSAKPGRTGPETWVVQANGGWSSDAIEASPAWVEEQLLAALADALGIAIPVPIASLSHRWRYALSAGIGGGPLWNPELRLGVCGDWLVGPRIESAWLSGRALARAVGEKPETVMLEFFHAIEQGEADA